jgi:hypothetical protein
MEWLPEEQDLPVAAKAELARYTMRERLAASLMARGYSQTAALKEAGFSGNRMPVKVRALMVDLMDSAGLSEEDLLRTVKAGTAARKSDLNFKTGEAVDTGPDWSARFKFTELALKLRGSVGPTRTADGVTVNAQQAVVVRNTPALD